MLSNAHDPLLLLIPLTGVVSVNVEPPLAYFVVIVELLTVIVHFQSSDAASDSSEKPIIDDAESIMTRTAVMANILLFVEFFIKSPFFPRVQCNRTMP